MIAAVSEITSPRTDRSSRNFYSAERAEPKATHSTSSSNLEKSGISRRPLLNLRHKTTNTDEQKHQRNLTWVDWTTTRRQSSIRSRTG